MTDPEPEQALRIAILGGGIVGLTLCVALHRLSASHVQFTLYESAQKFSEIGAGIMIGWNALQALRELGLGEEYERMAKKSWGAGMGPLAEEGKRKSVDGKEGGNQTFFEYRFGDGRQGGEPFCALKMIGGQLNTHRAELLDLLLSHLPRERVRFGKQLVGYQEVPASRGGGVRLTFADGLDGICDVLLGADGIRSTVRRLMYEKRGEVALQEPRWSGSYGYRSLIPTHLMRAAVGPQITATPLMWVEPSRHVVHYPVADGRWINIVAFRTDYTRGRYPDSGELEWVEHNVDEREVIRDYEGTGEQVRKILSLVERPSKWAMFDVPDLPYFVQGNVGLLGDAAHAMTPHLGNGASQGIEDAHLLANLLSHPKTRPSTVSSALKAFELVRKVRVQRVKELSYETGRMWELNAPGIGADTQLFEKKARETMDWVWGVDVRKQVQTAIDWFELSLT